MKAAKNRHFNYKPLIRSAARRIWLWSPMHRDAIKNALVRQGVVGCAECKLEMKRYEKPCPYQVDHIVPASEPSASILSFDDFFKRLFVPASEHTVLCKPCHAIKTKSENQLRVKGKPVRKKAKKSKR